MKWHSISKGEGEHSVPRGEGEHSFPKGGVGQADKGVGVSKGALVLRNPIHLNKHSFTLIPVPNPRPNPNPFPILVLAVAVAERVTGRGTGLKEDLDPPQPRAMATR